MKDKKIQDEQIRKMLQSAAEEEVISPGVEPAILKKVAERKEYREQIMLYQRRAKTALFISTAFLLIYGISSTIELASGGANDPVQVTSFTMLAFGGMAFVFVALQLYPKKS